MVMRCLIKVLHFAVRLGVRVSVQSFGIVDEELAARKVKKWINTASVAIGTKVKDIFRALRPWCPILILESFKGLPSK